MSKASRKFLLAGVLVGLAYGGGKPAAAEQLSKEQETAPSNGVKKEQNVQPKPETRLFVTTLPQGAVVALGERDPGMIGSELGITPLTVPMAAGAYRLTLQKAGYETAVAEVTVREGQTAHLSVRLDAVDLLARRERLAGHALLWPGLVAGLAGIILIEADGQGNAGKAGIATAGVGVAAVIAGAILLGLGHREPVVYTAP